jgi:threonine dehydratase
MQRVYGVQAANIAPVNRSLDAGEPVEIEFHPTIADGIAVKRPVRSRCRSYATL